MGPQGTCDSFYGPDVRVVAVFDFDIRDVVLLVERFDVAFDESEDLVESVFVSGNLLS